MKKIFGYSLEDLAGKTTSILYESDAEYEYQGRIRFNLSAEEKAEPYEVSYRRKDGRTFLGETIGTVIHAPDGSIAGYIGVIRDVTARKKAEESQKLAASVFTHAREGITITNAAGTIIDVNETFCKITGYAREEVLGKNPRILKSGRQGSEFYKAMWTSLLNNRYWRGEIWNQRKNGELFAEHLTISAVCDDRDHVQHYVALFTDITHIKEHQHQLEHMAYYDVLTGLPNRTLLSDRLRHAMRLNDRRERSVAVAYLDLDDFKIINDTHGHAAGDEFLVKLTERMKSALRDGDTLARLGGDEFVAVLVDIEKLEDCEPVLSRLLTAATEIVFVDDKALNVSASIGVTLYPQDGVDADQLLRHADQAMYTAKQLGKNQYHLFDVHHEDAIIFQRESVENIKQALERNEFVLYYQPKVNMKTGQVIGAEALIRWQHPVDGLLAPAAFLPVIESHPVSVNIGDWVIDTALKQMSEWHNSGLDIPVSVNVGALQLQHPDFTKKLATTLSLYSDVHAGCLELEILETTALDDLADVSALLHSCIDIGVTVALDDFGTGFSSLTYLKRLPAKMLKIDQSFIRNMLADAEDQAIVKGVIGLAKAFNRQVIAEGVETIEHGTRLLELGCEFAQGYGIARPMPSDNLQDWVSNWQPDSIWLTEEQTTVR